jgi:hypothetical protein
MLIEPTERNGLSSASRLMIDMITTVPKARLGKRIGKLNDEDVVRLNRDTIRRACPMTGTEGPESKIAPHSNGKCSPKIPEFYRSALSYESLYPNHAPI